MSAWRRATPGDEALAAYLEGEMTASEKLALETELEANAKVRGRLGQLRQIREALSAAEPALEGIDLPAAVQAALRRPAPTPARRSPWWAAVMGTVALATSWLILSFGLPHESGVEFRARSLGSSSAERWAGIQAYRLGEGAQPEPLGPQMSASDGLMFAYTNLGPDPFEYVMIFARGSTGQVSWFHPAYEREGTDPASTPIEPGRAQALLAEVIRHEYEPGPLTIYGLFTRRPLQVSAVEAWLGEHPHGVSEGPSGDCRLQVLTTRVSP